MRRSDRPSCFEELPFTLRLSEDLPVVIDIGDTDEKIRAFLPVVDQMIDSGLTITEKMSVIRHGRKAKAA